MGGKAGAQAKCHPAPGGNGRGGRGKTGVVLQTGQGGDQTDCRSPRHWDPSRPLRPAVGDCKEKIPVREDRGSRGHAWVSGSRRIQGGVATGIGRRVDKTKERPDACCPLPLPGNRPSSVDPRLGLARRTGSSKVCRDLGPVKSDSDLKAFGRAGGVLRHPEERLAACMLPGPSVVVLCGVDRYRTRSTTLGVGLRETRGAHSSPAHSLASAARLSVRDLSRNAGPTPRRCSPHHRCGMEAC